MGGCVTVGRVVAAADVAALEADPEVEPAPPHGEAVLATVHLLGQLHDVDVVEVGARAGHDLISTPRRACGILGEAMSQQNVDLVMALQRAPDDDFVQLIRDDEKWARLAAAVAPFVHADAETVRPGLPGGKTYTGLDGFRDSWLDWLAPWAEYRTEVNEAIDCGERVLLLQSSRGRLEGSTKEVRLAPAVVYTVRDGKIARFEPYADPADALEAVGLRGAAGGR